MARARAHDTAFYLCRPFCGTTERHLVFMATPQPTPSNPRFPSACRYPPPSFIFRTRVFVVRIRGEQRGVHEIRVRSSVTFVQRSVDENERFPFFCSPADLPRLRFKRAPSLPTTNLLLPPSTYS